MQLVIEEKTRRANAAKAIHRHDGSDTGYHPWPVVGVYPAEGLAQTPKPSQNDKSRNPIAGEFRDEAPPRQAECGAAGVLNGKQLSHDRLELQLTRISTRQYLPADSQCRIAIGTNQR